MRKGSPPTTSREPSSAVTNHHQHELSQVANKPIIQPKGTTTMDLQQAIGMIVTGTVFTLFYLLSRWLDKAQIERLRKKYGNK